MIFGLARCLLLQLVTADRDRSHSSLGLGTTELFTIVEATHSDVISDVACVQREADRNAINNICQVAVKKAVESFSCNFFFMSSFSSHISRRAKVRQPAYGSSKGQTATVAAVAEPADSAVGMLTGAPISCLWALHTYSTQDAGRWVGRESRGGGNRSLDSCA